MTEEVTGIRGVHRLAGAVLLQAIEDVRLGSGRRRQEALHWIMASDADDQFSFQFCCRMLHRDPVQVRRWASTITYEEWDRVVSADAIRNHAEQAGGLPYRGSANATN